MLLFFLNHFPQRCNGAPGTFSKDFAAGEIEEGIHLFNNPHLLPTVEDFDHAMKGWPFLGTRIRPIIMPLTDA